MFFITYYFACRTVVVETKTKSLFIMYRVMSGTIVNGWPVPKVTVSKLQSSHLNN